MTSEQILAEILMAGDEPVILGVNERWFPTQHGFPGTDKKAAQVAGWSEDPPATVCVLVAGDIGDYAAYIGHGTPQWVAKNGNKISFHEAQCHFANLDKEKYRER